MLCYSDWLRVAYVADLPYLTRMVNDPMLRDGWRLLHSALFCGRFSDLITLLNVPVSGQATRGRSVARESEYCIPITGINRRNGRGRRGRGVRRQQGVP